MIDGLISKIQQLGAPVVVGLDPTPDMIPPRLKHGNNPAEIAEAMLEFNREIIDAIWDLVPAVKPQIAMYERYGIPGLQAYIDTATYAKSKGLYVIGDIKRGDISTTALAYAAHIGGISTEGKVVYPWPEDAITLNPYMGTDGITPFLDICASIERAVFLLVKTSNPGSADLQDLPLANGNLVYEQVADLVSNWGKDLRGKYGYSKVGAVVGATFAGQGRQLRARMPHTFFLVPGYGEQGGKGKDLRGFFDCRGLGCIVNSSRGITGAWKNSDASCKAHLETATRQAVLAMTQDLREAWE